LVWDHHRVLLQRNRLWRTAAGLAEVNFQLAFPLQAWITTLNLPFTFVALVILALALYLLTPENYLTVRQALPGAIFFSVGWIIATKLFQLYVARYDRYNPTYLALASIVVLLYVDVSDLSVAIAGW